MMTRTNWLTIRLLTFLSFLDFGGCASDLPTKRGLAFHGDEHKGDNELLLSENSTISWYYTWSLWPSQYIGQSIPFVPLIHGVDDASDSELKSRLNNLPSSSTHILAFNEPDGELDTGGSSISPSDAAEAYLEFIAPLRDDSRKWLISYPSVTGSSRGLDWLRDFNESCYEIDDNGCPMDFVAVHWYGDFPGLASWLGTLQDFYNESFPEAEYWITEMALPQQDGEATLAMMNESLRYLDELDSVAAYAWFGAFRSDEANEWTGDEVSLFDGDGDLTELGALYLGGEERGFEEGMSQGHSQTPHILLLLALSVTAVFWTL